MTAASAPIMKLQVPVPEHAPPLQPTNVSPMAAVAVRVIAVPGANDVSCTSSCTTRPTP